MSGPAESAGTGSSADPREQLAAELSALVEQLTNLLRPMQDDIRMMDANYKQAHGFANKIGKLIRTRVFSEDGFLDPAAYDKALAGFNKATALESDEYEVYSDDLDYLRKLRNQGPRLSGRDEDNRTIVRARRLYVETLRGFLTQASSICVYLKQAPSSSA